MAKDALVRTGLPELDKALLGGLRGGELAVVSAETFEGRVAFVGTMVSALVLPEVNPTSVTVFLLEKGFFEFSCRLISSQIGTPWRSLKKNFFKRKDWRKGAIAGLRLLMAPLHVCDKTPMTVASIREYLQELGRGRGGEKESHGLVIVDFVDRVRAHKALKTRDQELGSVLVGLKHLARQFDVPIVCTVQLFSRSNGAESVMAGKGAVARTADAALTLRTVPIKLDGARPGISKIEVVMERNREGQIERRFGLDLNHKIGRLEAKGGCC